jgi:uncharacterized protein (DUF302 family)
MSFHKSSAIASCALMTTLLSAGDVGRLEVWPVDPLIKVFRDAAPTDAGAAATAEVARGEHATLQAVIRSESAVVNLRAVAGPLALDGNESAVLTPRPPRFVGYVPVDRPIQNPPRDQLRKPPADFPDPLLEAKTVNVAAKEAQPVWVTVPIPTDAGPGTYRGQLELTAEIGGGTVSARLPLRIQVYGATVGRSRLWVTNWFAMHSPHMVIHPEPDSPAYWTLLRRYARNMAEHRQNVALISPLALGAFTAGADGTLAIDFTGFDRWVDIFTEEGVIGRIEGGHIGGRAGGWESTFVVQMYLVKDGAVERASVAPESPEADRFYARFFPALVAHLREKGWLEKYVQHLADEPIPGNAAGYRAMAKLARAYAPELKIIEACHTKDLVGAIDVWVPQLNFIHQDYEHYRGRQKAGEEVWFYTCVFPQGEYANRFIEQPLAKTRLLHWINYRYGITGYLHWGYNHWTSDSPFTHTTRAHPGPPYLPAGDAWIVYPGPEGPLDSIRFEAMRDGIADHELLSLLAGKDPSSAERLASKHVLAFDRYNLDVEAFRATRRELLELLSPPAPQTKTESTMLYLRVTPGPIDTVKQKVEEASKANGFGVIATIDLTEKMRAKGVAFAPRCYIVEVCNPVQAKKVLEANMTVSTALPCRISIYEEGGAVTIATFKPTAMIGLFNSPQLLSAAQSVEEVLVRIIDTACEAAAK